MELTELKLKYDNYLKLNYTSKSTINSYTNCFEKFLKNNNRIYRLTKEELKKYLVEFAEKYSISYYNQMLSSLKIIYFIMGQDRKLKGIPYKKDSTKNINILSREEVYTSIKNIGNLKHKNLIKLLYIGALRSNELLSIKIEDIDSQNNRICINNGKGGYSRYIPISNDDLASLREYVKEYRPIIYLFEGVKRGTKYSKTSLRKVVQKMKSKKKLYPHLLRHTALTNLCDDGHNLLKVQLFAGHKTPKSTQRYYHLRDEALQGMILKTKG